MDKWGKSHELGSFEDELKLMPVSLYLQVLYYSNGWSAEVNALRMELTCPWPRGQGSWRRDWRSCRPSCWPTPVCHWIDDSVWAAVALVLCAYIMKKKSAAASPPGSKSHAKHLCGPVNLEIIREGHSGKQLQLSYVNTIQVHHFYVWAFLNSVLLHWFVYSCSNPHWCNL